MKIENELQLKSSKKALKILKKSLKAPIKKGIPKILIVATKGHINELIKEIETEIAEYKTQKAIKELESEKKLKTFKNSKELFKDLKK